MSNATSFFNARCRKKKVESFIIPPTYYRVNNNFSIQESKNLEKENIVIQQSVVNQKIVEKTIIESQKTILKPTENNLQPKVSAFSLAGIKGKKELQESNKLLHQPETHLPNEAFTENDMLLYWNKYAQRLSDKGHKIMESLMLMNNPKLIDNLIIHELPNEGSRLDFDNEKLELIGFLRSHLKNHDLMIQINVNETAAEQKFAFTDQDKYERLLKINANLELLKKTFDLDF